jgi:hypothetical protein
MRYNTNGSVNIEETYAGDRRFTKEEYVYLWNLFEKMDPDLFLECKKIVASDPVELFLQINSHEYYASRANLS